MAAKNCPRSLLLLGRLRGALTRHDASSVSPSSAEPLFKPWVCCCCVVFCMGPRHPAQVLCDDVSQRELTTNRDVRHTRQCYATRHDTGHDTSANSFGKCWQQAVWGRAGACSAPLPCGCASARTRRSGPCMRGVVSGGETATTPGPLCGSNSSSDAGCDETLWLKLIIKLTLLKPGQLRVGEGVVAKAAAADCALN